MSKKNKNTVKKLRAVLKAESEKYAETDDTADFLALQVVKQEKQAKAVKLVYANLLKLLLLEVDAQSQIMLHVNICCVQCLTN
jgi:hypothetical protein